MYVTISAYNEKKNLIVKNTRVDFDGTEVVTLGDLLISVVDKWQLKTSVRPLFAWLTEKESPPDDPEMVVEVGYEDRIEHGGEYQLHIHYGPNFNYESQNYVRFAQTMNDGPPVFPDPTLKKSKHKIPQKKNGLIDHSPFGVNVIPSQYGSNSSINSNNTATECETYSIIVMSDHVSKLIRESEDFIHAVKTVFWDRYVTEVFSSELNDIYFKIRKAEMQVIMDDIRDSYEMLSELEDEYQRERNKTEEPEPVTPTETPAAERLILRLRKAGNNDATEK